jgi:cyclase
MNYARLLFAALLAASPASADGPFTMDFEELGPGVWAGIRPDAPRSPVMGNTTFVISDEGVVVFDGGGVPAMSDLVIDKIRSLTDLPVTHVITSHWHGDHNFGIYRFAEEYENVQFIAHQFTRDVFESERIHYIDRSRNVVSNNLAEFRKIVETGVDSEGDEYDETERAIYQRLIDDGALIDRESVRSRVTPPNVVINDQYTIESGERRIELLYLGHGNTAGDIVMWLPEERLVASGDIVVLPSPYAFNMPPRSWAETLRRLKALDYQTLVPGHGPVQRDTDYIDLLIEAAESIADQRDRMLADGKSVEEVEAALDFSAFEKRFTHGDDFVRVAFENWFEQPFRCRSTTNAGRSKATRRNRSSTSERRRCD